MTRLPGAVQLGTCFGFAVRSSLPFHYLREGAGDPLDVSVGDEADPEPAEPPVVEWAATPELPYDIRLFDEDGGYRLWISTSGWFRVDPGLSSVTVPADDDVVRREERIWGLPAMLCMLSRGDLPLHAAAVEVGGKAIVLGAPKTFGKTTLAAAFANAGFRLLSEDNTCIRLGETPAVIPGPAMLRVRHDVAAELEIEGATLLGAADDRVHLALDPARRGDCAPVPLAGIVLLRTSDEGTRTELVAPTDAIRDLWPLSFRIPNEAHRTRCFVALTDLVRTVPTRNLYRPLRLADLEATVELVAQSV